MENSRKFDIRKSRTGFESVRQSPKGLWLLSFKSIRHRPIRFQKFTSIFRYCGPEFFNCAYFELIKIQFWKTIWKTLIQLFIRAIIEICCYLLVSRDNERKRGLTSNKKVHHHSSIRQNRRPTWSISRKKVGKWARDPKRERVILSHFRLIQ